MFPQLFLIRMVQINSLDLLRFKGSYYQFCIAEFDVKEWDEIYLTDSWVEKATKDGIKYPKEYFVISRITKNESGKPVSVNIMGSMGGYYHNIPWNTPNLIKRKEGNALSS